MVDLSSLQTKLKNLSIKASSPFASMKKPVGDGKKSSYRIFSVAGETVALGETGLVPTEKALHNKADFQRLYVPASLQNQQPALEELYIRMFPLTASQSKREILPPEDPAEFDLLRESLHYRLELLRSEILEDTSDGVEIREKLSRFDRLDKLIESLESNFRKKRRQAYLAIVTSSSAPVTKEPKIPMSNEDIDELLRRFGLILLQSQHQLPGFKFPVSPNQIVREVQATQLDDEEGFLEEVKKEGEIPISIEDVLLPDQKEKRLLETLAEKLDELIGSLGDRISPENIGKLDIDLSGKTFEQGISDLLKSLFDLVEDYESTNNQADTIMQNMESKIGELEEERDECQQKLLELTTGVKGEGKEEEDTQENKSEELQRIREQKQELEDQLETFLAQIRTLKQGLIDQQTQQLQKEEAVRKLGIVGSELETLRAEAKKKDEVIRGLREKEEQLDSLRSEVSRLEEQDQLSKEDTKTLQQKATEVDRLSAEKQTLEQRLADYQENIDELQSLVSSIPLPKAWSNSNQNTPFDQLKRRIMSLIPVYVVNDTKPFPADILSLPVLTLPSLLSAKASRNTRFCDFLNALSQLVSKYFDSEQGQALEKSLTAALDEYNTTSIPARTAIIIQKALLYSAGEIEEPKNSLNAADLEDLGEIASLKPLASQAESVFLEGQPEEVATQIQSYTKILDQKNLPSYPVIFLLYLLALRDWVNCVQINSKPLECPQIPPRLQRTVTCS